MHQVCPPVTATVTVTSFVVAITANAGADQTVCSQEVQASRLNGSVTGATGGAWTGCAELIARNSTTLNAIYTPTAAEIASGFYKSHPKYNEDMVLCPGATRCRLNSFYRIYRNNKCYSCKCKLLRWQQWFCSGKYHRRYATFYISMEYCSATIYVNPLQILLWEHIP